MAHPGGRPTKYDPDYHPTKAYDLCAEFGSTDRQLALFFEVTQTTINNWKKDYPEEFFEKIRAGKDYYNSRKIERSLRKRSTGYRYTETTKEAFPTTVINEEGQEVPGPVEMRVSKIISKHVSPDFNSMKFWLTKRDKERWPDKQEIDLTGNLGIDISEMDEKRKLELRELAKLRSVLALQERRDKDEPTNPS